jgi:hypothetical protein
MKPAVTPLAAGFYLICEYLCSNSLNFDEHQGLPNHGHKNRKEVRHVQGHLLPT